MKGGNTIAIYHLSIKIISRGKGKSAVAAAAYRSGETLTNEYDGLTHDYTRKGGIVHTEILLPQNAPSEYADRYTLWNAVEKSERYKTAQLAREIEIALPAELTQEQNIPLVCEFAKRNFVEQGMCADVCIHDKDDGNPHAHIMLTMRPIEKDGKWGQKSRTEGGIKIPTVDWNEQTKAEDWRKAWADICNQFLERNNAAERIDHRSFERQGIEQIPTVHLGVAAFQMEKRGIRTERGNINREIGVTNSQIRQLKARINKLRNWLKEEVENTAPPTLADVFEVMLNKKQQQGRYKQIADLKTAAKTLAFIQENNIMDMAGLKEKVSQIYSRHGKVGSGLNAIEKRLKVLDEHIKQAEYYRDFKPFNDKYKQMKPKHQEAYFEAQRRELTLFQSAQKYFAPIMKGRTSLPLKEWKDERAKLTADKKSLYQEYHLLKDEVREVEIIRRNVEDILRGETRSEQPKRAYDMIL